MAGPHRLTLLRVLPRGVGPLVGTAEAPGSTAEGRALGTYTVGYVPGFDQGLRAGRGGCCVGCGRCGAALGEGDRFCAACGAPAGGCPSCGGPVSLGDRFCRACGHQLAEPGPVSPVTPSTAAGRRVAVAERRVCSVLFCDVVGFTPLSEALDPEA